MQGREVSSNGSQTPIISMSQARAKRMLEIIESDLSVIIVDNSKGTDGWRERAEELKEDIYLAKDLLGRISGSPELKFKVNKELGYYFKEATEEYAQALEHFEEALRIREELPGNQLEVAHLYHIIADIKGITNDYPGAADNYQKALEIMEDSAPDYKYNIAELYKSLALTYELQKKYDTAISKYQKALDIIKEENDYLEISYLHDSIGDSYKAQGDYAKALDSYKEALEVREDKLPEQSSTKVSIAMSHNNIGEIYGDLGEHTKAIEHFDTALGIIEGDSSSSIKSRHLILHNNIGEAYKALGKYNEALEHLREAWRIKDLLQESDIQLFCLNSDLNHLSNSLAEVHETLDRHNSAVRLSQETNSEGSSLGSESLTEDLDDTRTEEEQMGSSIAREALQIEGIDTRWMDDQQIYKSAQKIVGDSIHIPAIVDAHIPESSAASMEAILRDSLTQQKPIGMLINLSHEREAVPGSGSHWILKIVMQDSDGRVNARLIDSRPYKSEYETSLSILQDRFNSYFGSNTDVQVRTLGVLRDSYNCGPWALYVLEKLEKASSIEEVDGVLEAIRVSEDIDIQAERARFLSLEEQGGSNGRSFRDSCDVIVNTIAQESSAVIEVEGSKQTEELGYNSIEGQQTSEGNLDDLISLANIYSASGGEYLGKCQYEQALENHHEALDIRKEVLGEKHPDTAISYYNIGGVYYSQGKYEKALEYYHNALKIEEEVLGEQHPDTATSYDGIGYVYYSQGNYGKALEYCHKALEIRKAVLGKNHPDTAISYYNIGYIYYRQGKYEKALEHCHKALEIRKAVLGKNHPETATSYNNVGMIYKAQGKYEKALEYYHKALKIEEEVLGEQHPDTASSYNNVGNVYCDQGNYVEALEYCHKALGIRKAVLGKNHPDTAISYYNIGYIYYRQGKYEKALEYYHKALSIRKEVLGEQHPETAISYYNICYMYCFQGKYEEALEYCQKALKIREEVLGENHPDTATSYNDVGMIYKAQGNYEKALECYHKALSIRDGVLGEQHPDTAISYYNINIVFSKLGLYKEKREFSRRKEGISNEAIKPKFGPNILPVEIQLKDLLGKVYELTEQGNWSFEPIFKLYLKVCLKGIYLQKKLGKLYSPDNLEAAKMLILKYVCMATVHNNMEHTEVLLYFALEHKDLVIQTTKEHPDYFIEKGVVREFQVLYQGDEEYQTALSKVLEEDNSDEEEKVMDDSCHSALSHYRDDEDEEGAAGGSSGSSSGHSTFKKAAQSSSSSSNQEDGGSSKGGSTKTGETPPSKSALLAVAAEIESHGALIHDERLKIQLEHYAKTGVVYDTLAPYVEAAEAAHPTLFREDITQQEARDELKGTGDVAHINQELVGKIIGSIAERSGITYDEKLAAQAQHFVNTGNIYDTLHAYLYPQRVIEGMQQREAEEQVHEYEYNQTNITTCATCAQEANTFIEVPEMPTYITWEASSL